MKSLVELLKNLEPPFRIGTEWHFSWGPQIIWRIVNIHPDIPGNYVLDIEEVSISSRPSLNRQHIPKKDMVVIKY